jgi:hypothetical protein
MKRIAFAALLITGVLGPVVVTGLPMSARADVVAVSLPTTVSIADQTLTFSGTVRVGSSTSGLRSASLWFRYPDMFAATRVGTATSRRQGFLILTASLDATRIVPGMNQFQVRDDTNGDIRTVALDLRRRSRVMLTQGELRADGHVELAVKVSHYDPKLGSFAPSRLSPVRLQEKIGDAWVPRTQVTTGGSGLARVLVTAEPGVHVYRAVRPDGATVLAATSKSIRIGQIAGLANCASWRIGPAICARWDVSPPR